MPVVLDVQYCFNCGRRVNPQAKGCWFCAAPTQRVIRPARQCPFCLEPIQAKAIKCPHCGEFLDGRATPQQVTQPQTTYVIEKAIIQHGHMIGAPQSSRGLIDAPGSARLPSPLKALPSPMKALPAPTGQMSAEDFDDSPLPNVGESSAIDVMTEPSRDPEPAGQANVPALRGARSSELVRVAEPGQAGLPATRGPGGELGPSNLPALPIVGSLMRFMERMKKPPVEEPVEIEATEAEGRYRVCEVCGTETLTDDNFCYHCGVLQGKRPYPQSSKIRRNSSNFFLNILILACIVGAVIGPELGGIFPGWTGTIKWAGAIGAPLLSAAAIVRGSGFFGKLIALALFLLSLGAFLYVWL